MAGMASNRAQLFGASGKVAIIPTGGAVIGQNVYNADGTLYDPTAQTATQQEPLAAGTSLDDIAGEVSTASSSAAAANAQLAAIASDNLLSPAEKPTVIRDYAVITTEQPGIDAQAVQFLGAGSAQQVAYDNAITALTAYLATLTAATAWNDKSGYTDVVGADFDANFNTVYTTRQTLLNAIYAAAKALADTAQGTANTAQGTANTAIGQIGNLANSQYLQNPFFSTGDLTGWTSDHGSVCFESGANGPASASTSYAVFPPGTAAEALRNVGKIPVYPGAVIKAQCAVRGVGTPNGVCGVRISWRDAADAEISATMTPNPSTGNATNGTYVTGTAPAGAMFAHVECATSGRTDTTGYYTVDNFAAWALADSLDQVPDGPINGRTLNTYLNANRPVTDFADTFHRNKNLGYVPDGGGRYGVHQVDGNGLAVIDFSQSAHVNKTLDNIPSGVNFASVGINQSGNLIRNPTAANGSSGWTLNGWETSGYAGSTYFSLSTVNATDLLGSDLYQINGISELSIGVDLYTLTMTGGTLYVQIIFSDASGGYISQAGPGANFEAASFNRYTQTIPVPAGATEYRVFAFCSSDATGTNACVRRLRVEAGAVANPFDDSASQMGNLATVPNSTYKAYVDFGDTTAGGHLNKTQDHLPAGTTYGQTALADLYSSGGVSRVGLRVTGSGHRLGDQGNAPASLTSNLGMVRSATALTASSTGAVNVNAHTVTYGPRVVTYNAVTNAVTGLAQSSSYYIYTHDNGLGGSPTWLATTSAQTANGSDDAYNAGSVTIPTSGTSGGGSGGGGSCVGAEMWLRPGLTARRLADRWRWWKPWLWCLRGQDGWHFVRRRPRIVQEPCCRVTVADGASLECSNSTPVTTQTGESILAPLLYGHCMWTDSGWQRVVEVDLLSGLRDVVRICVGGHTILAGANPYRRLSTHNIWKP